MECLAPCGKALCAGLSVPGQDSDLVAWTCAQRSWLRATNACPVCLWLLAGPGDGCWQPPGMGAYKYILAFAVLENSFLRRERADRKFINGLIFFSSFVWSIFCSSLETKLFTVELNYQTATDVIGSNNLAFIYTHPL